MKSDGIELDVHLSKDGEIIVTHDENVQRVTCGVDAMVKDLTLAELKSWMFTTASRATATCASRRFPKCWISSRPTISI